MQGSGDSRQRGRKKGVQDRGVGKWFESIPSLPQTTQNERHADLLWTMTGGGP